MPRCVIFARYVENVEPEDALKAAFHDYVNAAKGG